MVDNDSEFMKSSLRANAVAKKRLDTTISILDKAKHNVAVDTRRSQATYRRRLKEYRDRQKDIMLSRTEAPPTTAAIGEFLLRQIAWRRNQNAKIPKHTFRKPETARSVIQGTSTSSSSTISRSRSRRVSSANPACHNAGSADNDGLRVNSQNVDSKQSTMSRANSICTLRPKTAGVCLNTELKVDKSRNNIMSTLEKSNNDLKMKRETTSIVTFGENTDESDESVRCSHSQNKKAENFKTIPRVFSRLSTGTIKEKEDEDIGLQEEYEANLEFGRVIHRHRSKLDLRPQVAWTQSYEDIVLPASEDGAGAGAGKITKNPFHNMKGSLGRPNSQVRYFDDTEMAERGSFYNFLVQNRLQRESTKFQEICDKVNEFCSVFDD